MVFLFKFGMVYMMTHPIALEKIFLIKLASSDMCALSGLSVLFSFFGLYELYLKVLQLQSCTASCDCCRKFGTQVYRSIMLLLLLKA